MNEKKNKGCSSMKTTILYINKPANLGIVDSEINRQFNEVCECWTQVVQRVVIVFDFNYKSRFRDISNGNYLSSMKLIRQCDPFLKSHK